VDLLGHNLGYGGLCGGHAGFQGGAFALDAIEFNIEFTIMKSASDVEADGLPALRFESVEDSPQRDRLSLGDDSLGLALSGAVELVYDVAWAPQPGIDVIPNRRFDAIGPDSATGAASGQRATFEELTAAAIPSGLVAPGADVGQTTQAALEYSPQEIGSASVLWDALIGCQGILGGLPESRGDQALDRTHDDLAVPLLGPPAVAELALVDRVGHHVSDEAGAPDRLGVPGPDALSLTGAGSRNPEAVEFVCHPPAAPALESNPAVDAPD